MIQKLKSWWYRLTFDKLAIKKCSTCINYIHGRSTCYYGDLPCSDNYYPSKCDRHSLILIDPCNMNEDQLKWFNKLSESRKDRYKELLIDPFLLDDIIGVK